MLTASQISTLATELNTDPASLGYAAMVTSGNDAGLVTALNLARAGGTFQQFAGVIPSYQIVNATDPTEWTALSASEKQRYQTLTGAGEIDTANANVRNAFLAMFAAGTATRTALSALAVRQGSRAEVLFGLGISVGVNDVSMALRGKSGS